ncbi:hypothetical protein KP509_31G027200 [Ceratopteris richardii]|nr:hypothetical protein KP509_31G027200 [Ceratopteris richardii]
MCQECLMWNDTTMVSVLCVCTSKHDLVLGKHVHARIGCSTAQHDIIIGTALVNMYGKIGDIDDAQIIFDNMHIRNVVSWSSIIALCTKHGRYKVALQSFETMLQEGVLPNTFTFVSIISTCASQDLSKIGKMFHGRLIGTELEKHPYMANALTNMYGKSGNLNEAESVFNTSYKKDTYSWNMILAAYAEHGKCMDAIKYFHEMMDEGTLPDSSTFVYLLSACANKLVLVDGMNMHMWVTLMGLETDIAVSNTLLNMYGKCNALDVANHLLNDMPEKDVVSWNTLISGHAHNGLGKEAFSIFQQMIQEGMLPNQVTYTCLLDAFKSQDMLAAGIYIHTCAISQLNVVITSALVNMYGKCGSFQRALKVFHGRIVQNVLLWNAMFAVCNQHERGKEALNLFAKMHKDEVIPDNFTFSNILSSCASEEAFNTGKEVHALAIEYGFVQDSVVATALVNMYGKCGSYADALGVFNLVHDRDVILWTSIINVSSENGDGKETIRLLHQMQEAGITPNHITFLSALSACSHSGLLNEGRDCFTSMQQDYSILPTADHYICMIDLLARSGSLTEAEKLMNNMPFQASYVSWTTLLGACKNENDLERGERVGKHLISLYPEKPSAYVVLSQIYTAAGREDDAEALIAQMKERTGITSEINQFQMNAIRKKKLLFLE